MKKIYIILAVIILIGLTTLYLKKPGQNLDSPANQPFPEEQINLVISGNLIINNPGFKKDVWYLVYEEPGKPGLSMELKFDDKSVCNFLGEAKPCSNLAAGDRAGIQGIKQNDALLVRILNMNIFSER